jgi:site-specific recombinase XerD
MVTSVTILAASTDYIDHAKQEERMPKPVAKEQLRKLRHFDTFLLEQLKMDNPYVEEIDQSVIQQFFDYLLGQCGAKRKTVREYLEVLWSVFAYLYEHKQIDDSTLVFIHQILTSEEMGEI